MADSMNSLVDSRLTEKTHAQEKPFAYQRQQHSFAPTNERKSSGDQKRSSSSTKSKAQLLEKVKAAEDLFSESPMSSSSTTTGCSPEPTTLASTVVNQPQTPKVLEMCFAVNAYKRKICIMSREKQKKEAHKYLLLENISQDTYNMFGIKREDSEVSEELDDYIHCQDCECFYSYSCLKHPMYYSVDRDATGYEGDDCRALRTLPAYLYVATSSIPNAGKGVFCKVDVPVGVVYGPYEGILRKDQKQAECDGYSWEIRHNRKTVFIDGRDPRYSNWMRFINSSRYESEQNLLAFQYGGSVYYRVFRPIDREKELLVWYGDSYGKALGVNTTPAKASKSTDNPLRQKKLKSLKKNPFIF